MERLDEYINTRTLDIMAALNLDGNIYEEIISLNLKRVSVVAIETFHDAAEKLIPYS